MRVMRVDSSSDALNTSLLPHHQLGHVCWLAVIKNGMKCLRTVHDTTVGVLIYIVAHCSSFMLGCCHFLCLLQLHGQITARSRQSRTMAVLILRVQPEKEHSSHQAAGTGYKRCPAVWNNILKSFACKNGLSETILNKISQIFWGIFNFWMGNI